MMTGWPVSKTSRSVANRVHTPRTLNHTSVRSASRHSPRNTPAAEMRTCTGTMMPRPAPTIDAANAPLTKLGGVPVSARAGMAAASMLPTRARASNDG